MSSGYLMEDPREAGRLVAKVDAAAWVDRYLLDVLAVHRPASIPFGGDVLEVGCGTGIIIAEVSKSRPDLRCVGVDSSLRRLTDGDPWEGLSLTAASAEKLPYSDCSFDAVCRLMLEYLSHPEAPLAEMFRVCKPGGFILLQDLDGQLVSHYPPDPTLEADLAIVIGALAQTGFDPNVGRRLYHLAYSVGFTELSVAIEGYHVLAGRISRERRNQWKLKFDIARPAIVATVGDHHADAAVRRFLGYLDRPDTLTFSHQFTVTGRRPI